MFCVLWPPSWTIASSRSTHCVTMTPLVPALLPQLHGQRISHAQPCCLHRCTRECRKLFRHVFFSIIDAPLPSNLCLYRACCSIQQSSFRTFFRAHSRYNRMGARAAGFVTCHTRTKTFLSHHVVVRALLSPLPVSCALLFDRFTTVHTIRYATHVLSLHDIRHHHRPFVIPPFPRTHSATMPASTCARA